MTAEGFRKYLQDNGWYNIYDNHWVDLTMRCHYECHESVAVQVQQYRDKMDALPWHKKLFNKIFKP